jgi:small-conductance mechanosensitive channel
MFAAVRSRVAIAVHDALRAAGIEIPFPQRDLHVKSPEPALHKSPPSPEQEKP